MNKELFKSAQKIATESLVAGITYFGVLALGYSGYHWLRSDNPVQMDVNACDQDFIMNILENNKPSKSLDVLLRSGIRNVEVRTKYLAALPYAQQYVNESLKRYSGIRNEASVQAFFSGSEGETGQVLDHKTCEVLVRFDTEFSH